MTPSWPAAAPPGRRPIRVGWGGALEKYARLVGPADAGAVTHSGGVDWPWEERDF